MVSREYNKVHISIPNTVNLLNLFTFLGVLISSEVICGLSRYV